MKIFCLVIVAIACAQVVAGIRSAWTSSRHVSTQTRSSESYAESFLKNRDRLSTIYLKNGNALTGEIVHSAPTHLTVEWKGALVTFSKYEILKVGIAVALPDGMYLKAAESASWPHANNPVVQLTGGGIVDGAILAANAGGLLVRELWGEGYIDYELSAASIQAILWQPFNEKENAEAKRKIASLHPALSSFAHATAAKPAEAIFRIPASGNDSDSFTAFKKAIHSYSEFWLLFKSILA